MRSAEDAAHFRQRVEELKALYPDPQSAVMGALHLAQKRHGGWLPPEALEEVADAMELTPAYVQSVASFYDMYHLEPVGRHSIEVCTNLSCALVGAQAVVDAFAEELGIAPGETTEDGAITFRLVECAGGCGYAPVVVVDQRYRERLGPDQVPAIVEEIRGR
ncbi:MAG TPA: NAD(P)H-dependent oxidoreductase subunit E [Gaiellaceae bacterium]|jgi:NADH-quinone oxidoreductase subunit E|nr:NAD(P)H-dependent oxidoreductase subunit E [Gaiellaceae bacterium]HEX2496997.1 NAD(P)H-dependent oxidoreductase subunit E [Gaiellaceae bacterium]